MELLIGDKVWSTWSMRPWLVLRRCDAPFTERLIRLRQETSDLTRQDILAGGSPSGKVPALVDGELTIWDSLAICEYLADRFPQAGLWPKDPIARALGRAAVCEMHAGFNGLRSECPMDLTRIGVPPAQPLSDQARFDIARIVQVWRELLTRFGGLWLLGDEWSIADAFFTPVATRFRSWAIDLTAHGDSDGSAAALCERLLSTPDYLEWERGALCDERVVAGGN